MAKRKPAVKADEPAKKRKVQSVEVAEREDATAAAQPRQAGDLFVLGNVDCGQAGRGEDFLDAPRPVPVLADQKVTQVACGGMHTLALASDGRVFSTGVNDEGALGRRTGGQAWEKANADSTEEEGDSWTWAPITFPSDAGRIVALSAGDSHSMALDDSGSVWGWGIFRLDGPYAFSPADKFALNPQLVYSPSSDADRVTKIRSGTDHVVALQQGGDILTWGVNLMGQLGRPLPRRADAKAHQLTPDKVLFIRNAPSARRFTDIAAGSYNSFAVTQQGKVFVWGVNNYGQLGLKQKGPLVTPHMSPKLKGIQAVAAGEHHTLALAKDGKVLSLGRPTYGRLGRLGDDINPGSDDKITEAGEAQGLDGLPAHAIAAGGAVSGCIAGDEQNVYLWGMGSTGQLGKGADDQQDEHVPHKLQRTKRLAGRPILDLSIGGQHAALIAADSAENS